ncbi:MAG TPA: pur operon repressor [Bacillales bacterium]|nr:pur operon repressor [Bacillales bacterium]
MKLKRSGRLVDMTRYLLKHPHELISLSFFSDRYESAKSSISEDLDIVKESFESQKAGFLMTVPGAAGGVKYIPKADLDEAERIVRDLGSQLEKSDRWLPGGYLYMTDILGAPRYVNEIGRLFASAYAEKSVDVVMTMETKGIPLAYATASHLGVPVVIVRRAGRVTEGSTVSINYVSGSTRRIQSMALARRTLRAGSNVLIIDDFMKAGGTMRGMMNLLEEFDARLAGIGVFVEAKEVAHRLVDDYLSLLRFAEFDETSQSVLIEKGSYFDQKVSNETLEGEE